MKQDELRPIFIEEICKVAPDIAPDDVLGGTHLLDDLGLDSMDVLNLVTALAKRFDISIPEVDYSQLETPDQAVAYLERKTS